MPESSAVLVFRQRIQARINPYYALWSAGVLNLEEHSMLKRIETLSQIERELVTSRTIRIPGLVDISVLLAKVDLVLYVGRAPAEVQIHLQSRSDVLLTTPGSLFIFCC